MKKKFKSNGFSVVCSLVLMLMFLQNTQVNSQVITRVLLEKSALFGFLPTIPDVEVPIYQQEKIDFERVLKDDIKEGRVLPRFAVKSEKNYTQADGKWTQSGDLMVWSIKFSANARSLNFLIKDFNLPSESQMYVYSTESNMIHGPVEPSHFTNKHYSTDIIDGSECYISIYCNKENYNKLNLNIYGVCQGILINQGNRVFQEAVDCHFDVNCAPIGNGWGNERDAVAQILVNGTEQCTGSLLNDECLDLAPNFLTAFHCLDNNQNGIIDQAEITAVNTWAFRFNYQSNTPTCPGNSTNNGAAQWLLFNGATFLSAFEPSDMGLIRLNQNIIDQPSLALAGWNRGLAAATNAVGIHHPRGDVKKISIENNALVAVPWNGGPADHWRAIFDQGLVQHGSSGSPIFDQNHRVVGQLHGNQNNICAFGLPPADAEVCWCQTQIPSIGEYGRFDVSWDRAGSAANNRLRDWLTNNNPGAITTNTIRVPFINVPNTVQYICSASNTTITLNNPIPGRVLSWTVTNPSLFATSGGASTSGTTVNAVLRAANTSVSGSAILTFTMALNGCNPVTITRQLWVGRPGLPITSPSGTTPIEIGVTQNHTVFLSSAPGSPNFIADWIASGAVSRIGGNFPATYATHVGNYVGTGNWQVTTSNGCGSRSNSGQYNVTNNCNPCPRIIINNPVSYQLLCEIPIYNLPLEYQNEVNKLHGEFSLIDQNGKPVIIESFIGNKHQTSVESLQSGVYFVKMNTTSHEYVEKAIIVH